MSEECWIPEPGTLSGSGVPSGLSLWFTFNAGSEVENDLIGREARGPAFLDASL